MAHAVAHAPAHPTNTGIENRKLLMWIFLGSECLFFGSLIATYLVFKNDVIARGVGPFPHPVTINGEHHEGILAIPLTSTSTFVLLMSSVTMVFAVSAAQQGRVAAAFKWIWATIAGGVAFVLICVVFYVSGG